MNVKFLKKTGIPKKFYGFTTFKLIFTPNYKKYVMKKLFVLLFAAAAFAACGDASDAASAVEGAAKKGAAAAKGAAQKGGQALTDAQKEAAMKAAQGGGDEDNSGGMSADDAANAMSKMAGAAGDMMNAMPK